MNFIKWNLVSILVLSLISTGSQTASKRSTGHLQRRHVPPPNQSFNGASYWEHILREFVFKTISPPPPGNNQLYKRLLEAPFYGGPFPIVPNAASSVVLSRGDVYYLPNGHWVFCSEGCSDCEVCTEHTHPTVKWVLRRIKRISSHGSARHDLQLTIVPQVDGSYHMRSLSPQSYVYVTSQGEQDAYLNDRHSYRNDGSAYANVVDDLPGLQRRDENFWKHVDRTSLPGRNTSGRLSNDTAVSKQHNQNGVGEATTERVESTSATIEKKNETKVVRRQRPHEKSLSGQQGTNDSMSGDVRLKENTSSSDVKRLMAKHLIPKLILGTDQTGQKHLVHVVPADAPVNTSLSNLLNSVRQNRTAYQRVLRRIFDSLNSNRRSIESFLEPLTTTEKVNQDEEHLQQETRGGFPGLTRRQGDRLYPLYNRGAWNESFFQNLRSPLLNWSKQRRMLSNGALTDRSLNSTVDSGRKLNNSYAFYIHNSNNTLGDSFNIDNATRNVNQEYRLLPYKYKILVTTESTIKYGAISNSSKNIQNHSDLAFPDQSILLENSNRFAHFTLRNSTEVS